MALRKLLVLRVPIGTAPPAYTPGRVTPIPPNNPYDKLAAHDTPGSNVPKYSRRQVAPFDLGTLAPGQVAATDVALTDPTVTIQPGDTAPAGYTMLPAGVVVTASVTATDIVRVWFENRYAGTRVAVSGGSLNVIAATTVGSSGDSEEAWTSLNSPGVKLLAGEKLMMAARTGSPGDDLQIGDMSWFQIGNLA